MAEKLFSTPFSFSFHVFYFFLFVVHLSRLTDRCFCAHIHTLAHEFTMVAHAKGGRGSMCSFSALSITLQLHDKRFSTILQVQVHNAFASLSLSVSRKRLRLDFFFC